MKTEASAGFTHPTVPIRATPDTVAVGSVSLRTPSYAQALPVSWTFLARHFFTTKNKVFSFTMQYANVAEGTRMVWSPSIFMTHFLQKNMDRLVVTSLTAAPFFLKLTPLDDKSLVLSSDINMVNRTVNDSPLLKKFTTVSVMVSGHTKRTADVILSDTPRQVTIRSKEAVVWSRSRTNIAF